MKDASFRHCNGHVLAAVDVETTGNIPFVHEIWQIGIVPLNKYLQPVEGVTPFYMPIKPERPQNIDFNAVKVTKFQFLELMKYAVGQEHAADMLGDWIARLNLPLNKKLMPVWSNGVYDRDFLMEWLSLELYNQFFYFHMRDTQELALSINDRYALAKQPLPFNRVGLNSLAAVLGVINENPHDALSDCLATAEVYKKLLQMPMPNEIGDSL